MGINISTDNSLTLVLLTKCLTLNEYIDIERANKYAAAREKKSATTAIAWEVLNQTRVRFARKVNIEMTFNTKHRYDDDNLFFRAKFALDGLAKAMVIKSDSPKWISLTSKRGSNTDENIIIKITPCG